MRMKKGKVKHEPVIIQPIQNTEDDIVPDSPKVKKKKKKKNKQKSDEEALDETFASNVKSETEDNFSDTTSFMESVETSSQQSEYIDDTPRKKKKEKKSKQKSNAKALDETFASNVKPETADNFSDTTSFMESVETSSQQSECIDDTPRKKKKKKIKREVEKLVPFPEEEEEEESKEIENKKEKKNGVLETDDKKTSSKSKSDTLQPWSKEKLDRLINQIEAALPKNDNLKYCSRLAKLDWKAISFDEYSPEECQETWRQIQNKIRCYRILKEILHDAREYVNQNDPFTHNGSRKYKSDGLGFAKPKSAFQLFHQSMREKHPSRAPGELLERCKIKWKNMSEKKKVVWIETAQQEEARYKEELRKYQLEHPEYVPPPMKTLITKQDKHILDHFSGKPKKPAVNAYSLYSQESLQNGSLKEIPAKDRLAEISRRWKALSQQQRDAYVTRCEQLQKEYKIEYQKYLDTLPPEKRSEELEKMLPKKRKTDSKGSPAKKIKISEPVQPPVNEFELFKQKHENEWDKSSPFSIDDQARAKWKKVPKNEKEKYSQELKKLKNQYISSLTEYLKHCPPEKLAYYVSLIASQQHNLGSGKVIMSSEDDNFDIDSE